MGCDIHLHTEIKVKGQWLHYGAPNVDRNYKLFEKMAGVRGDEQNAIVAPRGTPSDISDVTKIDLERWDSDGHSHSWLNAEELDVLTDWYRGRCKNLGYYPDYIENQFGYLFGNSWAFKKYPKDYPKEIEDVRAVFWFDN